jgi:NADPH:quinone reductase-like Zn-dependent oxidoreductase
MRAVIVKEPGDVENLVVTNIEKPVPGNEEVLVHVKAFSINPVDIKTRKGMALYKTLQESPPVILGWDVSGIVESTGEGVTAFRSGDEVFGMINFPGNGKAYAEYVVAPAGHLAHKPKNISHQEAAASSLALLTAWQVLTQQANLQKGQRLFMQAAAGGVGHFGVQIGKHLGAYVIGTGSAANEDFIRQLGADEFVNYKTTLFEERVSKIDVVFDAVGGHLPLRALPMINEGGKLICIAGGLTEEVKEKAKAKNIQAISYMVHSNGEDMKELAALLQLNVLKPYISYEFRMDQIKLAHLQSETGKTRGKIVAVP